MKDLKGDSALNVKEEEFYKATGKSKPIAFAKHEYGITCIQKMIHKGWITRIKYYPDLNYILSSSLDGFLHIHDIDKLDYKEGKTFNLH